MIEPSADFVLYIQKMNKEKTGKELSYREAWEGAGNLIGFFDLLYKIDFRNKSNEGGAKKLIKNQINQN